MCRFVTWAEETLTRVSEMPIEDRRPSGGWIHLLREPSTGKSLRSWAEFPVHLRWPRSMVAFPGGFDLSQCLGQAV